MYSYIKRLAVKNIFTENNFVLKTIYYTTFLVVKLLQEKREITLYFA